MAFLFRSGGPGLAGNAPARMPSEMADMPCRNRSRSLRVAKIKVLGREPFKATLCGGEPVGGADLLGFGEYLAGGEGVDGQLEMLAVVYSVFVQAPKVIRLAGLVVDDQDRPAVGGEVYTIYLAAETEWRFGIGHCGGTTRGTKFQFHLNISGAKMFV